MVARSPKSPGPEAASGSWLHSPQHRVWLLEDAAAQLRFFRASLGRSPGFHTLDYRGRPLPSRLQALHTTTRLVHSYALGLLAGFRDGEALIDQGLAYLWKHHRDPKEGGYFWAMEAGEVQDNRKLAYGHVFVLLAASSAKLVAHPDADRLLADVTEVLETRFWEAGPGLYADEWTRDWQPFSNYRGMNANMHGTEALMAAFEATGETLYLSRAGQLFDFFLRQQAPRYGWQIPEHYDVAWRVDADYAGDPLFRPSGTTPGHSFEWARLLLQYWDLQGRPDDDSEAIARQLINKALQTAWDDERGGFFYTLDFTGQPLNRARYWWPVTEAIGALAACLKLRSDPELEAWYRRLWSFAAERLIDFQQGGWFPELDAANQPAAAQFDGKPDIYHALQANLFPLMPSLSRLAEGLGELQEDFRALGVN